MKFVIINDIHLGPESYYKNKLRKINQNVKSLLDDLIKKINKQIKPQFVINLGDLIQDDNKKNDRKNISYVIKKLTKLNYPSYQVAGNHDLRNISEAELAKLFKLKKLYYSFDINNLHFIILFSRDKQEIITVPDDQKKWLQKNLKSTNKKTIVIIHHSLADQNLKGNPWFEGRPNRCLVKNRKEIRKIIKKSKKVIAVFNSHLHWNKLDIYNSIPYFTVQSLVENENDKGIPSEAFTIVNIKNNKISVEVKGNYPKKFIYKSKNLL